MRRKKGGGVIKLTKVDAGGGGGLMKLTKVDEGGGGVRKCQNVVDVNCECSLILSYTCPFEPIF